MTPDTLHLVRIPLDLPLLLRFANRRRMPPRRPDLGYVVHSLLGEVFGDLCPKPFRVGEEMERSMEVFGYCPADVGALKDHADRYARLHTHQVVQWGGCASKPMPTRWASGTQLGFDVRACPVVRLARGSTIAKTEGQEIDAFLSAALKAPREQAVDREAVYRDWLDAQVQRHAGARLLRASVTRFKLERLWRRSGGERRIHLASAPDVDFEGVLEITDEDAFSTFLARGVGRHRAFGFGLLLIKPASRVRC